MFLLEKQPWKKKKEIVFIFNIYSGKATLWKKYFPIKTIIILYWCFYFILLNVTTKSVKQIYIVKCTFPFFFLLPSKKKLWRGVALLGRHFRFLSLSASRQKETYMIQVGKWEKMVSEEETATICRFVRGQLRDNPDLRYSAHDQDM